MSESAITQDTYVAAIQARMSNGEPFTYGILCEIRPRPLGENGRTADKLIQKWRRKGLIKISGRMLGAPRWILLDMPSNPDRREK